MTTPGLRPYLFMLAGCGWFAAMVLIAHSLGDKCPWPIVAAVRSAVATAIAATVAAMLGIPLVGFGPRMLWIRSLAGSSSMLATFYALSRLPASDVLTITNTFPIWVALLAWPLAGERPKLAVWGAVLCAVLGISVALHPHTSDLSWPPALCSAVAAFFTAIAMLGLNRLKGVAPLAIVVHFSAVSTLFALVASLLDGDGLAGWSHCLEPEVAGRLLAVGVTAVIGQFFLTRAYASGSPTKVSVVGLSQVVIVMAAEAILGLKTLDGGAILGTALVLGPTAWLMASERRPPKAIDEAEVEEVAIE